MVVLLGRRGASRGDVGCVPPTHDDETVMNGAPGSCADGEGWVPSPAHVSEARHGAPVMVVD